MLALLAGLAWAESTQITASVSLQVNDREQALQAVIAAARAEGGWFSTLSDSAVTLRLPVAKAKGFVATTQTLGKVTGRSWQAQSLDARLTDLHAHLSARQDVLQRYLTVLADARSEAMVTVQSEITRTLADIEQTEGQIRYLEHQAAYAQVQVGLQFQDRSAPRRDGSSSFPWLNTMNLSDLQSTFRGGVFVHRSGGATLTPPSGFAAWKKASRFAASSPDEVVLRVRMEKNKPTADLSFWTEALRTRQKEAGYTLLQEGLTKAASGQAGTWMELGAANGARDEVYLVALFLDGSKLVVVEAAGEASRFTARRDALIASLATVSF